MTLVPSRLRLQPQGIPVTFAIKGMRLTDAVARQLPTGGCGTLLRMVVVCSLKV